MWMRKHFCKTASSRRHLCQRMLTLAGLDAVSPEVLYASGRSCRISAAQEASAASPVTARWAALARVGASKTQLRDYVSVLQGLINSSREGVEELKRILGIEAGLPGPPASSPTPFAGGSTPGFFGGSDSQQPAQSGGGTPLRPLGPAPSPQGGRRGPREREQREYTSSSYNPNPNPFGAGLDENMQSEHRTRLAERLCQAATVGDVGAVQRILLRRADPNAVVWGGVTALMSAARHGRIQVAKLLLSNSAEPARTDMLGRTALETWPKVHLSDLRPGLQKSLS
eukprot:s53_g31.t1